MRRSTVAVVQHPPVFFDLGTAVDRAAGHVSEAAAEGADLVVFPEAWIGGFPAWAAGHAGWEDRVGERLYADLLDSSPVVGDPLDLDDDLAPLRRSAREHGVTVVIGLNERRAHRSGTLYNSLATIDVRGHVAALHRKLTPTHTEKNVWAPGDGHGLRVTPTPAGRIGGLICWENWNPLARQALHDLDEEIHVAAWPDAPEVHLLAARSYAFEGRCFVASAAHWLTEDDVPAALLPAYRAGVGLAGQSGPVLFGGGSGVVAPDGRWVAGPCEDGPCTLLATVDLDEIGPAKLTMDLSGHYQRPDVLRLTVDRARASTVTWVDP